MPLPGTYSWLGRLGKRKGRDDDRTQKKKGGRKRATQLTTRIHNYFSFPFWSRSKKNFLHVHSTSFEWRVLDVNICGWGPPSRYRFASFLFLVASVFFSLPLLSLLFVKRHCGEGKKNTKKKRMLFTPSSIHLSILPLTVVRCVQDHERKKIFLLEGWERAVQTSQTSDSPKQFNLRAMSFESRVTERKKEV